MTFKSGDIVQHKTLGIGLVKWARPDGKLEVDFEKKGLISIGKDFTHLLQLLDPETSTTVKKKLLPDMRELKRDEKYFRQYWDGCWEFTFNKALRKLNIKDASVINEWYDKYHEVPEGILFDEDDRILATGKQHADGNHFHEWQAAIILYGKYGYLSLVEKYELSKSHPRKYNMLRKLAGDEFAKFADSGRKIEVGSTLKNDQRQCPDLLVYKPDLSEWFFCEVKAGEEITKSQDSFFPIVRQKTGKPVYLLIFS